jgi:hypothetical protein
MLFWGIFLPKVKIFIDMSEFIYKFAERNLHNCKVQIGFSNRNTDIGCSSFLPFCFAIGRVRTLGKATAFLFFT